MKTLADLSELLYKQITDDVTDYALVLDDIKVAEWHWGRPRVFEAKLKTMITVDSEDYELSSVEVTFYRNGSLTMSLPKNALTLT